MILPNVKTISGVGKPRIIVQKPTDAFTSDSTLSSYSSLTAVQGDGLSKNITLSTAANPTELTLAASLTGVMVGSYVRIAGHTTIPNGVYQVIEKTTDAVFKINVSSTGGIASGTCTLTPGFEVRGLSVGMRVTASISGSPSKTVYAKITSISSDGNTLNVDGWQGGTPTDGTSFTINGFVIDLPRCQDMTETFDPTSDSARILHRLLRGRKAVKQFGWEYTCVLDYSRYVSGDTLLDIRTALNAVTEDSLVLIPRADHPEFQYNVYHDSPVNLSIFGQGLGHKRAVFTFSGKELVSSWPIISGYGTNYATNYGTCL